MTLNIREYLLNIPCNKKHSGAKQKEEVRMRAHAQ